MDSFWERNAYISDIQDWGEGLKQFIQDSDEDNHYPLTEEEIDLKLRPYIAHLIQFPHSPGSVAGATLLAEREKPHGYKYWDLFKPYWVPKKYYPRKNIEEAPIAKDEHFVACLYMSVVPSTRILLNLLKHWEVNCRNKQVAMDGLSFYQFAKSLPPDLAITTTILSQLKTILLSFETIQKKADENVSFNSVEQSLKVAKIISLVLDADETELRQIEEVLRKKRVLPPTLLPG